MPQLNNELDTMEQEEIVRACSETTEWVHNLVTVVKKDGTLRLCLDPRDLNKSMTLTKVLYLFMLWTIKSHVKYSLHLIRNIHYTASWEDAQRCSA